MGIGFVVAVSIARWVGVVGGLSLVFLVIYCGFTFLICSGWVWFSVVVFVAFLRFWCLCCVLILMWVDFVVVAGCGFRFGVGSWWFGSYVLW